MMKVVGEHKPSSANILQVAGETPSEDDKLLVVVLFILIG